MHSTTRATKASPQETFCPDENQTHKGQTMEMLACGNESQKELAKSPTVENADIEKNDEVTEHDMPEGGLRAWLVAAGAFGAFFCTLGYSNVFGVFQAWYSYHQLPGVGADDIAWIGSIQAALIFASGLLGGPLFDRFGVWIMRPAAVIFVFSVMMTSLCQEYWQFLLAQGILTGASTGFVMFPAMACITHYFDKKRGAAMGAAIAGSSIGGVVLPLAISNMLNDTDLGFGWTVRITGFIMIPILGFTCVAVKARLPPRKAQIFIGSSFKNPSYVLLIVSIFFTMTGMFVPIFMIPAYAITQGMSESLASDLSAIFNAASFFGRVIPGVLGDKLGRINTYIAASLSTGVLIFCWPLTHSTGTIIAISVLLGFSSGAITSGGSVALTLCADRPENVGTYLGVGMALASVSSLVSPPVSGAMLDEYGEFNEVSWFAGSMTLFGVLVAIGAKWKLAKGIFSLD